MKSMHEITNSMFGGLGTMSKKKRTMFVFWKLPITLVDPLDLHGVPQKTYSLAITAVMFAIICLVHVFVYNFSSTLKVMSLKY